MNKKLINYSQCWEDPSILLEALSICENDCVISITSGGDNTIALLLAKPNKIVSVDLDDAQNYLLELKIAAAKSLAYTEYIEFLGVKESERRTILFRKIHHLLSKEADLWWSHHISLLKIGVINCGRFERFTAWFARYILPIVHSKKTILKFLSINDIDEQKKFYRDQWDSKRWRLLFGLASSRLVLKRFARQYSMFTYNKIKTVAVIYRKRLERNLNSVLAKNNFFLHYSLMGRYGEELPLYLQEKEYLHLKEKDLGSILSINTIDLSTYLKSQPANTFSKFNLSDIFEALSPSENDVVWEEIIRTAKNGAVVVYWNNLVKRLYPIQLSAYIKNNEEKAAVLQEKDRVFFYDSFHINTIIK